jgi:hypothetical protein
MNPSNFLICGICGANIIPFGIGRYRHPMREGNERDKKNYIKPCNHENEQNMTLERVQQISGNQQRVHELQVA